MTRVYDEGVKQHDRFTAIMQDMLVTIGAARQAITREHRTTSAVAKGSGAGNRNCYSSPARDERVQVRVCRFDWQSQEHHGDCAMDAQRIKGLSFSRT